MTNPHAELIAQYAQDWAETPYPWERWEFCDGGTWERLTAHPCWSSQTKFRRKPATIEINGHTLIAPLKVIDHKAAYVYLAAPSLTCLYSSRCSFVWGRTEEAACLLKRGLLHDTPEAAKAHALALISFTTPTETKK